MLDQRQRDTLWRRLSPRLGAGAVGLVAVLFLIGCGQNPAPTPAPAPAAPVAPVQPTIALPTSAPVTGGNDSANVVARVTGNFQSGHQAALSFQTPGRVKEYKVQEGDKVKQGDVLASLDTTLLEFQVAQAQSAVTLAEARLKQAQTPASADQVAAANAALQAAQANFARVSEGPSADEVAAAKANLDRAKAALDQAQALYDKAGGATNPYAGLLPTSVGLQQATAGYDAAVAAYNLAKNHPTATELAAAASQLAQAKSVVAQLTPTAENIAIAQAGVDQANAALDLAKANLANATLVAPFDGTAVQLGPKAGEYANPGTPIVTLADLSQMQVLANVDELTVGGIQVGQAATLFVDALGGQTLSARVSRIGRFATNAGGVVSIPVTLDVDPTDAPIYPGLSATVQFQNTP